MRLKILQVGEQVLRQEARPLTAEEICSPSTQQLIEMMRDTMRDAPGVGLAAPQVGMPLQLAVIEDQAEYMKGMSPEEIKERERAPVPFQVIMRSFLSHMDLAQTEADDTARQAAQPRQPKEGWGRERGIGIEGGADHALLNGSALLCGRDGTV